MSETSSDDSQREPKGDELFGPLWYGEQDENGIDLSVIRENLKLTPTERIRRAERAMEEAARLREYGRRWIQGQIRDAG